MSNNQVQKMADAIRSGYRVKQNGDRVPLSKEIAEQYLYKIKAARARYGRLAYNSANGPLVYSK